MNFDGTFLTRPTGQLAVMAAVLLIALAGLHWHKQHRDKPVLPATRAMVATALPQVLKRDVAPVVMTKEAVAPATVTTAEVKKVEPLPLPLALYLAPVNAKPGEPLAPYGRLIPCETVVALESNRLDTPVIGLVTEDVWHDGRLVVPAGAEVHGKATLDPQRERLAVQGAWHLVWRTRDERNGTVLVVNGLALDRGIDADGRWSEHDGSAGLRGEIVRNADDRELKLFAASFLTAATAALQDTRVTVGFGGETSVPVASMRNAALAGVGAVLREQVQAMREAIARDGFYLRVPAGKQFYLYVTEPIDLGKARAGQSSQP
jgi:hypothetical protein